MKIVSKRIILLLILVLIASFQIFSETIRVSIVHHSYYKSDDDGNKVSCDEDDSDRNEDWDSDTTTYRYYTIANASSPEEIAAQLSTI
ncbi:MAG: hypothetical protein KAR21_17945, partial [Spirochaetales bacterium]|nr:hypothetical protein [Spirochaetales bacterium]